MDLNFWFPFIGFVLVAIVWVTTFFLCGKLVREFAIRCPEEAAIIGHQRKLISSFLKENAETLKRDPYLWHLRQRLKLMTWLAVMVPLLVMLSLGLYGMWETSYK